MSSCLNGVEKLLVVGNDGGTNVGGSFLRAADRLCVDARLICMRDAMTAPKLVRRLNWHLRGKRPTHLSRFSKKVVMAVDEFRPARLLATGTAPLTSYALEQIGSLGVKRFNFLTDDPWNPAHRAEWFLKTLPHYDCIFTPRRANISDLQALGCAKVIYMPFAFDDQLFHRESAQCLDCSQLESDVAFAGGADVDRVVYFEALIKSGVDLALYGDYWARFHNLRSAFRGYAGLPLLRQVLAKTKVAICLVRKANRDGHSMRTFEVPAVGACMLVEDTIEHREIFGDDLDAVVYFRDVSEMVKRTLWLLSHEEERIRLATTVHKRIVNGKNTYAHRLESMLCEY